MTPIRIQKNPPGGYRQITEVKNTTCYMCACRCGIRVTVRDGEVRYIDGNPNYAAHGGFCSVNMAAGMIYTIGGSFWEFGGPDLERAKLFVMIGTAEDHHSNPLKIAISKFKRGGGRFVSINPVRTGYSAIADEWVPIKPGTDGALLLALCHEIVARGLYDREFLAQYTNAGYLVNQDEASDDSGL